MLIKNFQSIQTLINISNAAQILSKYYKQLCLVCIISKYEYLFQFKDSKSLKSFFKYKITKILIMKYQYFQII